MDSTATTAQVLHRVQAHIDAERCDEARALLDCLPDDDLGTARMRAAIAAKEYAVGRLSNAQLREQVTPALTRLLREVDPSDDFQCLAVGRVRASDTLVRVGPAVSSGRRLDMGAGHRSGGRGPTGRQRGQVPGRAKIPAYGVGAG